MSRRATQKGHCYLCSPNKIRGIGRSGRDPFRVLRKLGKARRSTRRDVPDEDRDAER